jgi:hypothetical protein
VAETALSKHCAAIWLLPSLIAAACSGTNPGGTGSGRAGSGAATGTTGPDASADSNSQQGGSVLGSDASDAAGDGIGTDDDRLSPSTDTSIGDSESTPSINARQACTDYAASVCGTYHSCLPFYLQDGYGDVSSCVARRTPPCLSAFLGIGSGATPSSVEACAQAHIALSCSDYLSNKLPAACRTIQGSLPTGAPCGSGWQCAGPNGYCDVPQDGEQVCGTCQTLSPAGGRCTWDSDCQDGLRCPSGGNTTCVVPGRLGAPCDFSRPCAGTLVCVNGGCATQPSAGAPCDEIAGASDQCDAFEGFAQGLYCDGSHCAQSTIGTAGHDCAGPVTSGVVRCVDFGGCTSAPGHCPTVVSDGAQCGPSAVCQPPSECVGGICVPPDAATCR